jgi:hypothetical protein
VILPPESSPDSHRTPRPEFRSTSLRAPIPPRPLARRADPRQQFGEIAETIGTEAALRFYNLFAGCVINVPLPADVERISRGVRIRREVEIAMANGTDPDRVIRQMAKDLAVPPADLRADCFAAGGPAVTPPPREPIDTERKPCRSIVRLDLAAFLLTLDTMAQEAFLGRFGGRVLVVSL